MHPQALQRSPFHGYGSLEHFCFFSRHVICNECFLVAVLIVFLSCLEFVKLLSLILLVSAFGFWISYLLEIQIHCIILLYFEHESHFIIVTKRLVSF